MKTSDFIQNSLNNISRTTKRVLKDLSQRELEWHPASDCNSIGLIFFHMARFEDSFLLSNVLGKPQLWESKKWYDKLNMAADDNAVGYTAEKVAAFKLPDINIFIAYADEVRAEIMAALTDMDEQKFEQIVKTPFGEIALGTVFSFAIVHQAEHAGEISYIRGMQKGMNK